MVGPNRKRATPRVHRDRSPNRRCASDNWSDVHLYDVPKYEGDPDQDEVSEHDDSHFDEDGNRVPGRQATEQDRQANEWRRNFGMAVGPGPGPDNRASQGQPQNQLGGADYRGSLGGLIGLGFYTGPQLPQEQDQTQLTGPEDYPDDVENENEDGHGDDGEKLNPVLKRDEHPDSPSEDGGIETNPGPEDNRIKKENNDEDADGEDDNNGIKEENNDEDAGGGDDNNNGGNEENNGQNDEENDGQNENDENGEDDGQNNGERNSESTDFEIAADSQSESQEENDQENEDVQPRPANPQAPPAQPRQPLREIVREPTVPLYTGPETGNQGAGAMTRETRVAILQEIEEDQGRLRQQLEELRRLQVREQVRIQARTARLLQERRERQRQADDGRGANPDNEANQESFESTIPFTSPSSRALSDLDHDPPYHAYRSVSEEGYGHEQHGPANPEDRHQGLGRPQDPQLELQTQGSMVAHGSHVLIGDIAQAGGNLEEDYNYPRHLRYQHIPQQPAPEYQNHLASQGLRVPRQLNPLVNSEYTQAPVDHRGNDQQYEHTQQQPAPGYQEFQYPPPPHAPVDSEYTQAPVDHIGSGQMPRQHYRREEYRPPLPNGNQGYGDEVDLSDSRPLHRIGDILSRIPPRRPSRNQPRGRRFNMGNQPPQGAPQYRPGHSSYEGNQPPQGYQQDLERPRRLDRNPNAQPAGQNPYPNPQLNLNPWGHDGDNEPPQGYQQDLPQDHEFAIDADGFPIDHGLHVVNRATQGQQQDRPQRPRRLYLDPNAEPAGQAQYPNLTLNDNTRNFDRDNETPYFDFTIGDSPSPIRPEEIRENLPLLNPMVHNAIPSIEVHPFADRGTNAARPARDPRLYSGRTDRPASRRIRKTGVVRSRPQPRNAVESERVQRPRMVQQLQTVQPPQTEQQPGTSQQPGRESAREAPEEEEEEEEDETPCPRRGNRLRTPTPHSGRQQSRATRGGAASTAGPSARRQTRTSTHGLEPTRRSTRLADATASRAASRIEAANTNTNNTTTNNTTTTNAEPSRKRKAPEAASKGPPRKTRSAANTKKQCKPAIRGRPRRLPSRSPPPGPSTGPHAGASTRTCGGGAATGEPSGGRQTRSSTHRAAAAGASANASTNAAPSRKRKAPEAPSNAPPKKKRVRKPKIPKRKLSPEIVNEPPETKLDVYVFGKNDSGQLGLAHMDAVHVPTLNPNLAKDTVGVVQLAAGASHCVALTHDNKILTWGKNNNKQLGRTVDGTPAEKRQKEMQPTEVDFSNLDLPEDTKFVRVVATKYATFVLSDSGDVYGWGSFKEVVIADGNNGIGETLTSTILGFTSNQGGDPMLIPHLENITALAAGAQHVLALDSKGTVYGWGAKKLDQLSTKTSNRVPGASMVPHACSMTKPGKFKDVVSIGAGAFHSFAVLRNGEVYAWGYNKYGQTGIPDHFTATGFQIHSTTIPYATRVPVFEEKQLFVDYITGGFKHSVAVTKDNMCLSWGSIADAALGIQAADMDDQEIVYESATVKTPLVLKEPGRATGIGQSVAATTGPTHTLVISSKGVAFGNVAFGWGSNRQYETSIIQQAETLLPSELRGNGLDGKTVVAVAAGKEFSVLLTE